MTGIPTATAEDSIVRTPRIMLTAPGLGISRKPGASFNCDHSSGQMGEAIPGECGSASRRFSRLSQVHASRKLTPPSRTSILTAAARAFGGPGFIVSDWEGHISLIDRFG